MTVPTVHELTRDGFDKRFASLNMPVLIVDATRGWRSAKEWCSDAGTPDVATLGKLFGHHMVTIHSAKSGCSEMTVSEYAQWWASAEKVSGLLYLKDWHLAALEPDYGAYTVPSCLGEDWLNEHWAARATGEGAAATASGGDHRFVYVGPAGSRTRLHADVLFSYSWSANVVGTKRWKLVPPEQLHLVSDAATLARRPDLDEIPGITAIEIVQKSGELLFVPSGWYHQVENLTDCISINHNWLNAHNVDWALVKLLSVLKCVKTGLDAEDSTDGELCEDLLDRRCGMGLGGLCALLEGVIRRRISRTAADGVAEGGGGDGGGRGGGCGGEGAGAKGGDGGGDSGDSGSSAGTRSGSGNGSGNSVDDAFAIKRAATVLRHALNAMEREYEMETLQPSVQLAMVRQGELVDGLGVKVQGAGPTLATLALGSWDGDGDGHLGAPGESMDSDEEGVAQSKRHRKAETYAANRGAKRARRPNLP